MTPVQIARSNATFSMLMQAHEILQRPYTLEFIRQGEGSWFAHIVEFEGCAIVAETREEAEEMLGDAALYWLIASLKNGYPIPEPMAAAG